MVSLSPVEPPEFNAFETIARLSLSQNQRDLPDVYSDSNCPQYLNDN